jgi:hypothetical protein
MCSTDIAVLYWLNQHRRWPPQFPRLETLLVSHNDPQTPRDEWGAAEWRAYALFLEESGRNVMRDLARFEHDLLEARRKLSRRKAGSPKGQQGTLLGLLADREQKIRGRKPTGRREAIAADVIAIRTELEANGRRMTDRAALAEWFARNGKRRSRVTENLTLLNAVSEYRRSHKISKR